MQYLQDACLPALGLNRLHISNHRWRKRLVSMHEWPSHNPGYWESIDNSYSRQSTKRTCVSPCRRLLQRTDWFTQEKAACLLTAVLVSRPDKGMADVPTPPLVMNGSSSSSHHNHAPAPVPTPTAESEKVQSTLVTFIDWLTSQLRCALCSMPCHSRLSSTSKF